MRIAILMAGGYGIVPFTDGRKVQIQKQADALERIGHEVVRLNPWESYQLTSFDAVHLVEGGLGNIPGAFGRIPQVRRLGVAPFLDSPQASWLYRLTALAGRIHPRLMTHQSLLFRQAAACDLVVARSRDEMRLLVQGVGIDPSKVKIVLNGVDPPGPVEPREVCAELGIEGDFVFHVSMYTQARKNVARLMAAADHLQLPLVIAGTAGNAAATEAIKRVAGPRVKFVGQLSVRQRDSLYAACRVFALPSLYEGTGLVALEAASHGANVVITECGGPPDYFADLADYASPSSVGSIGAALERAWNRPRDGKLREHVLNYLTWESSARALTAAYGF